LAFSYERGIPVRARRLASRRETPYPGVLVSRHGIQACCSPRLPTAEKGSLKYRAYIEIGAGFSSEVPLYARAASQAVKRDTLCCSPRLLTAEKGSLKYTAYIEIGAGFSSTSKIFCTFCTFLSVATCFVALVRICQKLTHRQNIARPRNTIGIRPQPEVARNLLEPTTTRHLQSMARTHHNKTSHRLTRLPSDHRGGPQPNTVNTLLHRETHTASHYRYPTSRKKHRQRHPL